MTEAWVTKQGAVGRPLVIGLSVAGELVDFDDLDSPVLRMRRKTQAPEDSLEFVVTTYTDTDNVPALYNAQVVFEDWSELAAGEYIADVSAEYNSQQTFWPDGEYIVIRVLRGT